MLTSLSECQQLSGRSGHGQRSPFTQMSAHLSIQVLEHVRDWQIQLPAGLFNSHAPRQCGPKNRVRQGSKAEFDKLRQQLRMVVEQIADAVSCLDRLTDLKRRRAACGAAWAVPS